MTPLCFYKLEEFIQTSKTYPSRQPHLSDSSEGSKQIYAKQLQEYVKHPYH